MFYLQITINRSAVKGEYISVSHAPGLEQMIANEQGGNKSRTFTCAVAAVVMGTA